MKKVLPFVKKKPPAKPGDLYGTSPLVKAIQDLKAFNELPEDERARASAAHVIKRLNRDED